MFVCLLFFFVLFCFVLLCCGYFMGVFVYVKKVDVGLCGMVGRWGDVLEC